MFLSCKWRIHLLEVDMWDEASEIAGSLEDLSVEVVWFLLVSAFWESVELMRTFDTTSSNKFWSTCLPTSSSPICKMEVRNSTSCVEFFSWLHLQHGLWRGKRRGVGSVGCSRSYSAGVANGQNGNTWGWRSRRVAAPCIYFLHMGRLCDDAVKVNTRSKFIQTHFGLSGTLRSHFLRLRESDTYSATPPLLVERSLWSRS